MLYPSGTAATQTTGVHLGRLLVQDLPATLPRVGGQRASLYRPTRYAARTIPAVPRIPIVAPAVGNPKPRTKTQPRPGPQRRSLYQPSTLPQVVARRRLGFQSQRRSPRRLTVTAGLPGAIPSNVLRIQTRASLYRWARSQIAGMGITADIAGPGELYLPYEFTAVVIASTNTDPFFIDPEQTIEIS